MPIPSEQHVRIASRLYDARRSFRALRGDSWRADLESFMGHVRDFATLVGLDHLQAGMRLVKLAQEKDLSGGAILGLLAATVELVEPTPADA